MTDGVRVQVSPTSRESEDLMLTLVTAFGETVTLQVAVLPLSVVTVILAVPVPFAVTTPYWETVATLLLSEDQLKEVAASDGVTDGVRVQVSPTSRESEELMLTLVTAFGETVTLQVAVLPLSVVTVMLAVPVPFAVTTPYWETVATLLLSEDQLKEVTASDGVTVGVRV